MANRCHNTLLTLLSTGFEAPTYTSVTLSGSATSPAKSKNPNAKNPNTAPATIISSLFRASSTLSHLTLQNCIFNNVVLRHCMVVNGILHNCIIIDCKLQNSVVKKSQVVWRPLALRRFAPEIRALIFEHAVHWDGKMPALIVALRGDQQLYHEALAAFHKRNREFTLSGKNVEFSKTMPASSFVGVEALLFPDVRVVHPLTLHISPAVKLWDVRRIHIDLHNDTPRIFSRIPLSIYAEIRFCSWIVRQVVLPSRTIIKFIITIDADVDFDSTRILLNLLGMRLGVPARYKDKIIDINKFIRATLYGKEKVPATLVWKAQEGDYLSSEGSSDRLYDYFERMV